MTNGCTSWTPPMLLHGADYNPDQWLDRPDILQQDIALMQQAHINCVSMGIFSWSVIEPQEGQYRLDWLENIINKLFQAGIRTILATPTGALPRWLTKKYPEVLQVGENMVRNLPGKRHNFCYTSPVMRQKTMAIDRALSQRFGKHPAVILWHISNELGGNFADGACHCPQCQAAFRRWLQEKYHTLENLNRAWWTSFWSRTYYDWEEIHSPVAQGENLLHGLTLDWRRFVCHQLADFYRLEVAAVRSGSDLPATSNLMGYYPAVDCRCLAEPMDIVSWDSYPAWHAQADDVPEAIRTAAFHSLMRSYKKAPFLMMESTPSVTNWAERCTQKRPGMHLLSSLQAIAHGAASVQYFQWRSSRGGSEKFHGAVVGHSGRGDTRIFREVAQTGELLQQLTPLIQGTCNRAKVAILSSWDNWWSLDASLGPKQDMEYWPTILSHYQAFWRQGIDVDFLTPGDDLHSYSLVAAPMLYMTSIQDAEKIKDYVAQGGTFVGTYWTDVVDETDLCHLGERPLDALFGVFPEEIDCLPQFRHNQLLWEDKKYETQDLHEIVQLQGAEVLAVYCADYYAEKPALTRNHFGKGQAYRINARTGSDFLQDFYRSLLKSLAISNPVCDDLPDGVTVAARHGPRSLYFLQNFASEPRTLLLKAPFSCGLTGNIQEGEIVLPAYGYKILTDKEEERRD